MMLRLLCVVAALGAAQAARAGGARLVCYVQGGALPDAAQCTHVVYAGDARGDKLDGVLKGYRMEGVKILLRVTDDDKDLPGILKSKSLQGLEVHDAHRALNRSRVTALVEEARAALVAAGGGALFVTLPPSPELLAKYYDLRTLAKSADVLVALTHELGAAPNMTYHPSRLSGVWDMMNTDSVVDLAVGLGAPAARLLPTLPAAALRFQLTDATRSTPGSGARDPRPAPLHRRALCDLLRSGNWTLERDQDLSAPYAFKDTDWVAFEDAASVDVKGKYARVRGLAGLALVDADVDAQSECGPALLSSLGKVLNSQRRAPRGAVLRSLETEILSSVALPRGLEALQVSPYRITQVVDSDGVIHSLREDTRTEFSCSRQGYFVHPRSCARFYRCVKFDQLSPDYTVFEFDCPAGLAFDSRYEVCVWPGSLPDTQACPGSSEIAPVPRTRFVCPDHEGYYADPENCRWFFACMDHGTAPLSAYEFRCPFGLGFDASRLLCDWPWLVPGCGNIARYEAETFGYSGAALTGAAGFQGQSADSVNIAAHQNLISGASLNNLVGVQGGFLSNDDALSGNFIAAEEYAHGAASGGSNEYASAYHAGAGVYANDGLAGSAIQGAYIQKPGFVNAAKYSNGNAQYSQEFSGSSVGALNAENHGSLIHNINSGLTNGAAFKNGYQNYDSEDVEVTGSLIKDAYLERKPVTGYANIAAVQYVDHGANAAYSNVGENAYGEQSKQLYQNKLGLNSYVNVKEEARSSVTSHGNQNFQAFQSHHLTDSDSGGQYVHDDSGAYVHDSTGDRAEDYQHIKSETVPYVHASSGAGYKHQSDDYNYENSYKASVGSYDSGLYGDVRGTYNGGQYKHDNSEGYRSDYAGAYIQDYSGAYKNDQSDQYVAGIYRPSYEGASHKAYVGSRGNAEIGLVSQGNGLYNKNINGGSYSSINQVHENSNVYQNSQNAKYISDSKVYSGASHTLTAGAVNVGLVGKTSLVDADFNNQHNYDNVASYDGTSSVSHTQSFDAGTVLKYEPFSYVHQPAVAVTNVGSDSIGQHENTYGYNHVTTLSSVGVAPTASPIAVTTSAPIATYSYKPTFTPSPPKSDVKEVFGYQQPAVTFVQPTVSVLPAAPQTVHHVQPTVQVSSYTQQTSHQAQNYERGDISFVAGKANSVSVTQYPIRNDDFSGYDYPKPAISFEEPIKKLLAYTTGAPSVTVQPTVNTYSPPSLSTYRPDGFSHQTYHNVEQQNVVTVTQAPPKNELTGYDYPKPAVSFYENPLTQYVTPAPNTIIHYQSTTPRYVEPTEKYIQVQPIIQKHDVQHVVSQSNDYRVPVVKQTYYQTQDSYAYAPEIQRNIEAVPSYRPSVISHQVYHQSADKSQAYERKDQNTATFVSSTPSNIIYEDHYEYKAPVERLDYKQPEHVTPRQDYIESYVPVSSSQPATVQRQQHTVIHAPQVQSQYEYQSQDYLKQIEIPKPVVPVQPVSFSYESSPKNVVESIHISSYNHEPVSSTYNPIEYDNRHVSEDNNYKAEEYLPPVVSTTKAPEYLPPVSSVSPTYSPPTISSTVTSEYLPPVTYKSREYLPPKVEKTYIPVTTPKPVYKSTTQIPTYSYKSTTPVYKAPEYLPPDEDLEEPLGNYYEGYGLKQLQTERPSAAPVSIKYNPIQDYAYNKETVTLLPFTDAPVYRKHNLVVQTAKAQTNLLGFGTVGPDAGLVGTPQYSTTAYPEVTVPITQRYTAAPKIVSSTYAPIRQEIVEVTPSPIPVAPIRRTKPKIAVVTKINDFNPLLVRKLGAVCSCAGESPVLVLRGKKPDPSPKVEYDNDYGNDYDGSYNEDNDNQWSQKSLPYKAPSLNNEYLPALKAPAKVVTSTFNPIIVPDDSYYQDYEESRYQDKQGLSKQVYSENFVSSTYSPVSYSPSTENTVRIRPRAKAVTAAPTLKTILIEDPVTPSSQQGIGASQTFDRYGPGGWRSRDETLQGSVDCKRAGLFRHPKHCNKFYACRWDCTKERFTLHVFNCPVQLSFDPTMGACNWPSQGPACQGDTLLTNGL